MIVEIITIGDELLNGRRVDTNTAWIGRQCTMLGVPPRFRHSVIDDVSDIASAFKLAFERSDLIISTGGLGPTSDDVTFEGLAEAAGVELVLFDTVWQGIVKKIKAKGVKVRDTNKRQALLPKGSRPLSNAWGTAPGVDLQVGTKRIFSLPGVPREMKGLFTQEILPWLEKELGTRGVRRERVYTLMGVPESELQDQMNQVFTAEDAKKIKVAYAASFPRVELVLSVLGEDDLDTTRVMADWDERLALMLGKNLVSVGSQSLPEKIVERLAHNHLTISLAESLTGGAVTSRLVDVPGCSAVLDSGLVTYSNESKVRFLGVENQTLAAKGAVSKECALEMAQGLLEKSQTSLALATTGIAGPGGATKIKPVGLTYIALVGVDVEGKPIETVEEFHFRWDRDRNREMAVWEAMKMIWQVIK